MEVDVLKWGSTLHKTMRVSKDALMAYCQRWKITEFAVFGSILRDDFRPESDVDVLLSFSDDAQWTLLDQVEMQDELKTIFGREVDLVSKRGIEQSRNALRRHAILDSAEVVYVQSR